MKPDADTSTMLARMDDIAKKAASAGSAASRFLTPAEAQAVSDRFRRNTRTGLEFDGGFDGAERTRAVFTNPEWGQCNRTELFCVLNVTWRRAYKLTHRDLLGALMALGIERDTLGDIVCEDGRATLICLPELGDYIASGFTQAGRVGLEVEPAELDQLPPKTESLTGRTATVASLRLDAVLCAAFNLSRSKAVELVAAGRVSLNYKQCLQPAKELGEGAMLSVRGLGRVKLTEVGGTSRKGRIFLRLGLYER